MSVRIKICGITRMEDALAASELGADALGFVFHPPSPRYIEPERAANIIAGLPSFITVVGVFADLPREEVRKIAAVAGLDRVQLSGEETPEYCRALGLRWIKAFRLAGREDLERIPAYGRGREFLLDSHVKGVPGGTGKKFDWQWAAEARRYGRVILAGGLDPDNVAQAIRTAAPFGVDVSSGVESAPGIKDRGLLAAFIRAARESVRNI